MSRVGKRPINLPEGVIANLDGQLVKVKGPKGELSFELRDEVKSKIDNGQLLIEPKNDSKLARSFWGLSRTMVSNLVLGVSEGFSKKLEINGVGYRAQIKGKKLQLNLGFSHEVNYDFPEDVKIECPSQTEIVVSGIDKQKVGQVASETTPPW